MGYVGSANPPITSTLILNLPFLFQVQGNELQGSAEIIFKIGLLTEILIKQSQKSQNFPKIDLFEILTVKFCPLVIEIGMRVSNRPSSVNSISPRELLNLILASSSSGDITI